MWDDTTEGEGLFQFSQDAFLRVRGVRCSRLINSDAARCTFKSPYILGYMLDGWMDWIYGQTRYKDPITYPTSYSYYVKSNDAEYIRLCSECASVYMCTCLCINRNRYSNLREKICLLTSSVLRVDFHFYLRFDSLVSNGIHRFFTVTTLPLLRVCLWNSQNDLLIRRWRRINSVSNV